MSGELTIDCTDFFSVVTADADGTTVTNAMLQAGTDGPDSTSTWGFNPATPTGLTKVASRHSRLGSVRVRKTSGYHMVSEATKAISLDHSIGTLTANLGFGAGSTGKRRVSMGALLEINLAQTGTGLFDFLILFNVGGDYAALQLDIGPVSGGNGYSINIETDAAGTIHSNYVNITPPSNTFWVTSLFDAFSGLARAQLYNPVTGAKVGSEMTVACTTGSDVGFFRFGQNEVGTQGGGAISYFESMIIDYDQGIYPLGPFGSMIKLPNVGSRPKPFAPGNAR